MKRHKRAARGGLILVCVIACLVVTSALVALAVQSSLRDRHQARLQLQLRQTELLCEAGVLRAAKQLTKSGNYTGEQWRPELDLENFHNAVVDIDVAGASTNSAKEITVIAKLESHLNHDGPMQRTHTFTISMETLSTSPEKQ